jgi:magnesium transporter
MIKKYTLNNLTWIDLFQPTQEEVLKLVEEYDIHPNVADELLVKTFKPLVESYKNIIYLILHFPALKHSHNNEPNQEVDFIIGKDFLITSRYEVVDSIHKFAKEFETSSILKKDIKIDNTSYIFMLIMKKLYASIGHELESIENSLEQTEDNIFKGKEKEMVKKLSFISRDLLNTKQATNTHRETLESLAVAGKDFFEDDFKKVMGEIMNDYGKVRHKIETSRESLIELRDTNNSLLYTKQNETMKILTIMAFVTFPLSLIASIFGMNTENMPVVGNPNDFWILVGIMGILTIIFFLFFKYKKWL